MDNRQLNIRLEDTTEILCEECKNESFQEVLLLRKASRLITGMAQDSIVPIPLWACSSCGHVNEQFLPPALKNDDFVEFSEEKKP